jgi:hypothetical protein
MLALQDIAVVRGELQLCQLAPQSLQAASIQKNDSEVTSVVKNDNHIQPS